MNWVKQHRYALIVQNDWTEDDRGDQLYTVSMPGKRLQSNLNRKPKSYLFTDALVYTIAHWPVPPKLDFYVFTLIFCDIFFINNFSKLRSRWKTWRKIAPISQRSLKFVAQTYFCVHRWRFCNKLNSAKFSKSFIDRWISYRRDGKGFVSKEWSQGLHISYSTVVYSISCRM